MFREVRELQANGHTSCRPVVTGTVEIPQQTAVVTWGRAAAAEEAQNKEIINQKDTNNIVGIYGHSSNVLRQ